MCSRICKKIGDIFQHWKNPGFIQVWEQHVQGADFEEKHKLHALGQCAQEFVKISSIGKILVSSRIGGNVQDVDLDWFSWK